MIICVYDIKEGRKVEKIMKPLLTWRQREWHHISVKIIIIIERNFSTTISRNNKYERIVNWLNNIKGLSSKSIYKQVWMDSSSITADFLNK